MSVFTIMTYAMLTLVVVSAAHALSSQLGPELRPGVPRRRKLTTTAARRALRGRA